MSEQMTVSVKEAAELLGVGLQSTYRAVKRGVLPALRVGRRPRLRIPRRMIERVLEDPSCWLASPRERTPPKATKSEAGQRRTRRIGVRDGSH